VERRPHPHRPDHRRGLRRPPGPAERNRTDQFHGRQPLNDWISGIHAILPDLPLVLDVGPIADEQHLTAPATLASFTDAEGAGAHV